MVPVRNIASLIPRSERRVILERNYIYLAVANAIDYPMKYLMIVWKEYVEPTVDVSCNVCYDRVLRNYRSLQEEFIKLEREDRLLDEA